MFIFYLALTCVDAEQTLPETLPETIFSVTNNCLLVKSVFYNHEVVDYTDRFDFAILNELDII